MAGMHATTEIRRRIEDVYAGTTFRMRQRSLGKVRDQMVHVLAVEPNRRIDFEAEFGPVRPRFTLSFEPTATGTRVPYAATPGHRPTQARPIIRRYSSAFPIRLSRSA